MTDWDDEFNRFAEDDSDDEKAAGSTGPLDLTDDELGALAGRPGSKWAELARELLVIRQERAHKAEQEAMAAVAAEAEASGTVDFSDPAVVAGLRAREALAIEAADRKYARERLMQLGDQYGPELGAGTFAAEQAARAAEAWFFNGAQPSAAELEHEAAVAADSRARALAESYGRTWADDLAEAEQGIAEALAKVRP